MTILCTWGKKFFKMFDLDNLDIDFDEDFSSNVFKKRPPIESKNNTGNETPSRSSTGVTLKPSENLKRHVDSQFHDRSFSKKVKNDNLINLLNLSDTIWSDQPKEGPEIEKPAKKRFSHDGLVQRKFPGPAGLLPDKPYKEIQDLSLVLDKSQDREDEETKGKTEPVIYSQSSGSVFLDSAYQELLRDFDLNDSSNPLYRYTVEWVKKSAINKSLIMRKVPFLAVTIHYINTSTPDPVLVLRDPTGEINGTLHREVWTDLGNKLRAGIALALRQVGVLITGVIRRQIYLNITINNILAIYGPSESGHGVEITTVNKTSKADLLKSLKGWQVQAETPRHQLSPTASLFSTVGNSGSRDRSTTNVRVDSVKSLKNKMQDLAKVSGKTKAEKDSETLAAVFADEDFGEDMQVPQNKENFIPTEGCGETGRGKSGNPFRIEPSTQALSQAETLIFQEVLSGINLDEFEM